MSWSHGQQVGHANVLVEHAAIAGWSEAGVRKADDLFLFDGNEEPARIEIGLGIDVVFQQRRMPQAGSAPPGQGLVPNLGDLWRILVAELAEVNHPDRPFIAFRAF